VACSDVEYAHVVRLLAGLPLSTREVIGDVVRERISTAVTASGRRVLQVVPESAASPTPLEHRGEPAPQLPVEKRVQHLVYMCVCVCVMYSSSETYLLYTNIAIVDGGYELLKLQRCLYIICYVCVNDVPGAIGFLCLPLYTFTTLQYIDTLNIKKKDLAWSCIGTCIMLI